MKKNLISWQGLLTSVLLCLCALTFSSCGDDDDGPSSNGSNGSNNEQPSQNTGIYGSWYREKTVNGVYSMFKSIIEIKLNEDKTASYVYAEAVEDQTELSYVYNFPNTTYTYNAETGDLVIRGDYSNIEMKVVSVDATTLVTTWYDHEYIFTRGAFDWSTAWEGISSGGGGGGSDTNQSWEKQIYAKYHYTGDSYAIGNKKDFTGKVTISYNASTGKYAMYEPFYYPNSNGGKGLKYDAVKGYNNIKVYTYAVQDPNNKWAHLTCETYCQFTIE